MTRDTYELAVPITNPPEGGGEMFVVFNLTRGRVLGVTTRKDGPEALVAEPSQVEVAAANVLRLRIAPRTGLAPLSLDEEPVATQLLPVMSQGEVLELVRLVYLRPGQPPIVLANPEDVCAQRSGRYAVQSIAPETPLGELLLPPWKYIEEVEEAIRVIARTDARKADACRFFFEIDRATHTHLLPYAGLCPSSVDLRRGDVKELMKELPGRVKSRCRGALTLEKIGEERYWAVSNIASLFLRLISKHLGVGDPAKDDLSPVWDAFEAFACGDLRIPLASGAWTCQPSSGYYFLFGELALTAAASNIAPAAWERLAAPMIATQPAFTEVYAPWGSGRQPDFACYHACNYRPGRRLPSRRKEYENLAIAELAAKASRNVRDALPGAGSGEACRAPGPTSSSASASSAGDAPPASPSNESLSYVQEESRGGASTIREQQPSINTPPRQGLSPSKSRRSDMKLRDLVIARPSTPSRREFVRDKASIQAAQDKPSDGVESEKATPGTPVFLTPQSLITFPGASMAVMILWKTLGFFFDGVRNSQAAPMALAFLVGFIIYFVSQPELPTARDKVLGAFLGLLNSCYVGLFVIGVPLTF